jgi:DNA-binding CsgD family transcriptional regulator
MSLWKALLRAVRGTQTQNRTALPLDAALLADLDALAEQERRPREVVARDLLTFALDLVDADAVNLETWWTLSPREREVAALVCRDYSNPEIARRLKITNNTVKTHVSNILHKFELPNRDALRLTLRNWDFSPWER